MCGAGRGRLICTDPVVINPEELMGRRPIKPLTPWESRAQSPHASATTTKCERHGHVIDLEPRERSEYAIVSETPRSCRYIDYDMMMQALWPTA